MSGFGSFLLGMGQGALRERDRQEDMEDRKLRRELVRMQVDSAKQEKADKDALRAAGADVQPVEQTTTPVGQVADNGPNLPANPDPVTEYKVGDRFTYDAGEAQRMAAEQNTPKARLGRQVTALQKMGNPTAAATLQTQQLQLDDALIKHLDSRFDRSLAGLSTPDDIAKLVSESQNDGMGGALKIKAVPSPDGKRVAYHRLNEDGTSVPTGLEFENSTKGLADAKLWLSRNTSISDKIGHLRSDAQLKATIEARAADDARADKQLAENQRHNRVVEGISRERASGAGQSSGGFTMADLKDGHKAIASLIAADHKNGDASLEGDAKKSRDAEIVGAQSVLTGAYSAGIPITPEQAVYAIRNGQRGTAKVPRKDGSGVVEVPVIKVGDRIIPMAADPGFQPGGAPPPGDGSGQGPVYMAPAAPAQPRERAAPAPAPSPDSPVVAGAKRVLARLGDLGTDYTSEQGKAALAARVKDARTGGRALTETEQLRARQAGLI